MAIEPFALYLALFEWWRGFGDPVIAGFGSLLESDLGPLFSMITKSGVLPLRGAVFPRVDFGFGARRCKFDLLGAWVES